MGQDHPFVFKPKLLRGVCFLYQAIAHTGDNINNTKSDKVKKFIHFWIEHSDLYEVFDLEKTYTNSLNKWLSNDDETRMNFVIEFLSMLNESLETDDKKIIIQHLHEIINNNTETKSEEDLLNLVTEKLEI